MQVAASSYVRRRSPRNEGKAPVNYQENIWVARVPEFGEVYVSEHLDADTVEDVLPGAYVATCGKGS